MDDGDIGIMVGLLGILVIGIILGWGLTYPDHKAHALNGQKWSCSPSYVKVDGLDSVFAGKACEAVDR